MFITLISGLMAGPAVSFSGSPTVSPVTAALCFSLPLPVGFGLGFVLDGLLGVVPGAAGVGHEDGQQLAGDDHAAQEAGQGDDAQAVSRPAPARTWPAAPGRSVLSAPKRCRYPPRGRSRASLCLPKSSLSRNWMRHSLTIRNAARPTARMVIELNRKGTAPPISMPMNSVGFGDGQHRWPTR